MPTPRLILDRRYKMARELTRINLNLNNVVHERLQVAAQREGRIKTVIIHRALLANPERSEWSEPRGEGKGGLPTVPRHRVPTPTLEG